MAFATDLSSTDAFQAEVLFTPGVLQVVECYSEWAGPCKSVVSTLKSLYFSMSERPIKFYTVNTDKVKEKSLDAYRSSCQPVFLLFKGGVQKKTVVGVQGPELVQAVTTLSDPATGGV